MDAIFDPAFAGALDELPAPFSPGPLAGVLFAEDFDAPVAPGAPGAAPEPEPEIIEPVFTADDIEIARRDAYAAGLREARAATEASRAADRVTALASIAAGLAQAGTDAAAVVEAATEAVAALMLQMISRMLPALSAAHGEQEVRALARALLPALSREPRATIRVHPQHIAGLREELAELDPASAARIELLASPSMPPGDARIAWEAGSAKREAAWIQGAIETSLGSLGLLAPVTPRRGAESAPETQARRQLAGKEIAHAG